MKNLSIILISILVFSCGSKSPVISDVRRTITDSTFVKTTYVPVKDTIVVKGDTVRLTIPVYKISEMPVTKKSVTGRTTASVRKVDNKLEIDCFTDQYQEIIEKQNKIIETLTTRLERVQQVQTHTKFKTPWYSKLFSFIGIVTGCSVILFIALKFLKQSR